MPGRVREVGERRARGVGRDRPRGALRAGSGAGLHLRGMGSQGGVVDMVGSKGSRYKEAVGRTPGRRDRVWDSQGQVPRPN